jgi:hypothetical protein
MFNPWDISNLPGPSQASAPSGDGYPALPNSYGLGQVAGQTPQPMLPEEASRGFSPYALVGDANTRNPWDLQQPNQG